MPVISLRWLIVVVKKWWVVEGQQKQEDPSDRLAAPFPLLISPAREQVPVPVIPVLQDFEISKFILSDTYPLARPHHLLFPKTGQQQETKYLSVGDLWGNLKEGTIAWEDALVSMSESFRN